MAQFFSQQQPTLLVPDAVSVTFLLLCKSTMTKTIYRKKRFFWPCYSRNSVPSDRRSITICGCNRKLKEYIHVQMQNRTTECKLEVGWGCDLSTPPQPPTPRRICMFSSKALPPTGSTSSPNSITNQEPSVQICEPGRGGEHFLLRLPQVIHIAESHGGSSFLK